MTRRSRQVAVRVADPRRRGQRGERVAFRILCAAGFTTCHRARPSPGRWVRVPREIVDDPASLGKAPHSGSTCFAKPKKQAAEDTWARSVADRGGGHRRPTPAEERNKADRKARTPGCIGGLHRIGDLMVAADQNPSQPLSLDRSTCTGQRPPEPCARYPGSPTTTYN